MNIDFDEIRKEIAIEHNVLLDQADPVLLSITLHDMVLQRHVETLAKQNKEYLGELKTAQKQGLAEAKLSAGRMITDSANYVSDQINTAVTSALDEAIAHIKIELSETRMEAYKIRATAITAAAVSFCCAIITIAAAMFYFYR